MHSLATVCVPSWCFVAFFNDGATAPFNTVDAATNGCCHNAPAVSLRAQHLVFLLCRSILRAPEHPHRRLLCQLRRRLHARQPLQQWHLRCALLAALLIAPFVACPSSTPSHGSLGLCTIDVRSSRILCAIDTNCLLPAMRLVLCCSTMITLCCER